MKQLISQIDPQVALKTAQRFGRYYLTEEAIPFNN